MIFTNAAHCNRYTACKNANDILLHNKNTTYINVTPSSCSTGRRSRFEVNRGATGCSSKVAGFWSSDATTVFVSVTLSLVVVMVLVVTEVSSPIDVDVCFVTLVVVWVAKRKKSQQQLLTPGINQTKLSQENDMAQLQYHNLARYINILTFNSHNACRSDASHVVSC